jgi:hypothetical protein
MDIRMGAVGIGLEDGSIAEVPAIQLVLSERNLRTLLLTLDDENGAVTRLTDAGVVLMVASESNEVHYKERTAGLMDAAVEEKLINEELEASKDDTLYVPESFGEKE